MLGFFIPLWPHLTFIPLMPTGVVLVAGCLKQFHVHVGNSVSLSCRNAEHKPHLVRILTLILVLTLILHLTLTLIVR